MKSHPWDELNDSSKDFFDAGNFLPETEFEEEPLNKHAQRQRLTELRRRTEERLDWKRMYGELQFDDMDDDRLLRDRFRSDDCEEVDEQIDD